MTQHPMNMAWRVGNCENHSTPDDRKQYRSDSPFFPQNGLTQELMFERLTGLDVRSANFLPAEIDADTAMFLRAAAHDVNGSLFSCIPDTHGVSLHGGVPPS
jgi:hypothetical protein